MRIRIFGRGPLAQSIADLAERVGHMVRWADETPVPPYNDELLDLVILAGERSGVEADLANVSSEGLQSLIVVAAITPIPGEPNYSSTETVLSVGAESAWIAAMLPEPRIVRAFASVPAHVFSDLLYSVWPDGATRIAVPLAGDDRDAKAVVKTLMREIGVEPFDLGALGSGSVIGPDGPLWGKVLSPIEMVEAVGALAGDG